MQWKISDKVPVFTWVLPLTTTDTVDLPVVQATVFPYQENNN